MCQSESSLVCQRSTTAKAPTASFRQDRGGNPWHSGSPSGEERDPVGDLARSFHAFHAFHTFQIVCVW